MIVDSHCHLDYLTRNDLPGLIENARKSQVNILHTISTKLSEIDKILDIADQYENVYASVGMHPNEVGNELQ